MPDLVHDSFWDDLRPDAEQLPHLVDVIRAEKKRSATTGAVLRGAVASEPAKIAENVPCLIEETNGTEMEAFGRRFVGVTHTVYFGASFSWVDEENPELDFDYILEMVDDRFLRVIYVDDPAGWKQGFMKTALCKEE